jgi:hypothetical protein
MAGTRAWPTVTWTSSWRINSRNSNHQRSNLLVPASGDFSFVDSRQAVFRALIRHCISCRHKRHKNRELFTVGFARPDLRPIHLAGSRRPRVRTHDVGTAIRSGCLVSIFRPAAWPYWHWRCVRKTGMANRRSPGPDSNLCRRPDCWIPRFSSDAVRGYGTVGDNAAFKRSLYRARGLPDYIRWCNDSCFQVYQRTKLSWRTLSGSPALWA